MRAWIEITQSSVWVKPNPSPSSRGRGLKWLSEKVKDNLLQVALFTRAWIEIWWVHELVRSFDVALFTRAWIEIKRLRRHTRPKQSRPLHEGVDWNSVFYWKFATRLCRPLHEGVDWNIDKHFKCFCNFVALFTRAWIEMYLLPL